VELSDLAWSCKAEGEAVGRWRGALVRRRRWTMASADGAGAAMAAELDDFGGITR
jgi:hypothetical protein